MATKDLTLEVLKSIRDEIRQTNTRLESMDVRLGSMDSRLESVEGGLKNLERRLVDSELRIATAMADLAGTVREVTVLLKNQHDLRPRVEQCERDILVLKGRLPDA